MVRIGFHEATSWPCGPRQGAPGSGETWAVRFFFGCIFQVERHSKSLFSFFWNPVDDNMYIATNNIDTLVH